MVLKGWWWSQAKEKLEQKLLFVNVSQPSPAPNVIISPPPPKITVNIVFPKKTTIFATMTGFAMVAISACSYNLQRQQMEENSFKKWKDEMDKKREVEKIVSEAEKRAIVAQKRAKKRIRQAEEWAARRVLDAETKAAEAEKRNRKSRLFYFQKGKLQCTVHIGLGSSGH